MFGYYLRLALASLRRRVGLTALMVTGLGLGIGATMTSATLFRAMAAHPAPQQEGRLFNVQLDHWPAGSPYVQPGEPPSLLSYRDALALWQAARAPRQTIMYPGDAVIEPERQAPFVASVRYTSGDFFAMFEPPLRWGGSWSRAQDLAASRVAVLSRALNERLFDGADSVGRSLQIDGERFTVLGVLDDWHPVPRYYDVTGEPFVAPEDLYLPFAIGIGRGQRSSQNNNCWPPYAGDFAGFLRSECVWINFWIEVESAAGAERYLAFLDDYARQQKTLGRFPQPVNNRVRSIGAWLESQQVVRADTRAQLLLSFAFLAVCIVNTVSLLLARFLFRAREISVHRALGASRSQIFLRFLVEAAAIGLGGALLGMLLTLEGSALVRRLDPTLESVARPDAIMLAATVALSLLAALAAGLLPAWRACRMAPAVFLKSE